MTRQELKFWVPGVPVPQGSKKIGKNRATGKPVIIDDNGPKLEPWREAIAFYARRNMRGLQRFDGPVRVRLTFHLPRPASHHKRDWTLRESAPEWPAVKPDLDKLQRAAFDALTEGGVWADDSRAVAVAASKCYAGADLRVGVEVEVVALDGEEGL